MCSICSVSLCQHDFAVALASISTSHFTWFNLFFLFFFLFLFYFEVIIFSLLFTKVEIMKEMVVFVLSQNCNATVRLCEEHNDLIWSALEMEVFEMDSSGFCIGRRIQKCLRKLHLFYRPAGPGTSVMYWKNFTLIDWFWLETLNFEDFWVFWPVVYLSQVQK